MNPGYWLIFLVMAFVLAVVIYTIKLEADKVIRWSSYWSFSGTLLASSLFFVEADGYISFAQGLAIYIFFVIAWALFVLRTRRLVDNIPTREQGDGALKS